MQGQGCFAFPLCSNYRSAFLIRGQRPQGLADNLSPTQGMVIYSDEVYLDRVPNRQPPFAQCCAGSDALYARSEEQLHASTHSKRMRCLYHFFFHTVAGWRIESELPMDLERYIVLVAPHTSNYDFFLGISCRSLIPMGRSTRPPSRQKARGNTSPSGRRDSITSPAKPTSPSSYVPSTIRINGSSFRARFLLRMIWRAISYGSRNGSGLIKDATPRMAYATDRHELR